MKSENGVGGGEEPGELGSRKLSNPVFILRSQHLNNLEKEQQMNF